MLPKNPTIAVRAGEELDLTILDSVLKQIVPNLVGYPVVTQFPSGASNLTYLICYSNRELVLRRPPLGLKAAGAHSMAREYQVISALKDVYPTVPEAIFYTDDETFLGSEFYLMEKVEGVLVTDGFPANWNFKAADYKQFCQVVFDKLIELHQVNVSAAGLRAFGRPKGYAERQIEGWNRRFNNAATPDGQRFEDVQEWLQANLPAEDGCQPSAALIHGDYRIDNVMLDPIDPFSVVAVLDWEMAALGDPLMDLSNALAYWVHADDPPVLRSILKQPSDVPGMMRREEIIAYYGETTQYDMSHWGFYEVYGYWRLVGIMQQLYYRYVNKHSRDSRFANYAEAINNLGDHCQQLIAKSTL